MIRKRLLLTTALLWPIALGGQGRGVDPAELLKPLADSWPSYSGDYTGRRYSALMQVNQTNVTQLTLAFTARLSGGPGGGGGGGFGPAGPPPAIVGGEGTGDIVVAGATQIKGAVLSVNGVLYVTSPDNVWALDAHDGRELWHYFWKTKGGTHIGNRGVAMWGHYLYFVTPDDDFVSLDARTGEERWHKEAAPFSQQYFMTSAPMTVGNHIMVGTGNELDSPGYLMSFDPETGAQQWRVFHRPQEPPRPPPQTWEKPPPARPRRGPPRPPR